MEENDYKLSDYFKISELGSMKCQIADSFFFLNFLQIGGVETQKRLH